MRLTRSAPCTLHPAPSAYLLQMSHKVSISLVAKQITNRVPDMFREVAAEIMGSKLSALSPAVPLAIAAYYFTFQPTLVFSLSLLGLALLAERLNCLTEKIAYPTGPTARGLLMAAIGNIPELMRQASVNSYMLLMALFCHLLPMPFRNVTALAAQNENLSLSLSIAGSVTMLIVYFGNIVFQRWKADNQSFETLDETRMVGLWSSIVWPIVLITFIALLSKYVVETIEDASNTLSLSVNVLGIILLPIVGNVGRHNGAITPAFKDNLLDISMSVALGSATQISTFIVPLFVTIAWVMGIKMDLNFNLPETGFLTLTIVATTFSVQGWLPSFPRNSSGSLSLRSSFSFNLRFKGESSSE